MFFKIHENISLASIKYSKFGKNNEKNPSLLFRPVSAWDWAKTWLRHHVSRAHGPEKQWWIFLIIFPRIRVFLSIRKQIFRIFEQTFFFLLNLVKIQTLGPPGGPNCEFGQLRQTALFITHGDLLLCQVSLKCSVDTWDPLLVSKQSNF